MRLRTLPLSLSGVIMGAFIGVPLNGYELTGSFPRGVVSMIIFLLLTTALLQIISNLSNELGDALNGTDRADREGIHYSIQDGDMSVGELKRLIALMVVLCCISGSIMIWFRFGTLLGILPLSFLLLGALAIVAAMRYTLGKNPYGYRAKGDLFVFIFFGLVSTIGGFIFSTPDFMSDSFQGYALNLLKYSLLPACAIGFFSVGVLNVNNIRDIKSDALTRVTVAIKLGARKARIYQTILIAAGWLCITVYVITVEQSEITKASYWLFILTLPLFILHLKGVWKREGKALDPMLPLLVMSTFITTLLFCLPRCLAVM